MIDEPVAETHTALRQRAGLFLGPALMMAVLLVPPSGLSPEAHRLAAVMALVITFWVTEAIPLAATALLGPALCVVLGVGEDKKVLAPFASPITFLFIGTFMIAAAMRKYGLDRRMALWLLSKPALARTPGRLFATLGVLTAALSMWMSNVATTAMMLPIALGALSAWPSLGERREVRASLVLLIAFAASVGGLGTPVGTPPNLIGLGAVRELLGVEISFPKWMALAMPLVLVQTAFLLWHLRPAGVPCTTAGADGGATAHQKLAAQRRALGPCSAGEKNTITVFATAIALWMIPGLIDLVTGLTSGSAVGATHPVSQFLGTHFPEETVGLLAGVALLLLPVSWREGRFTLTWSEAVRIDWGTILVFAGGMALGRQLFDTGLARALGSGTIELLGQPSLWTLVAAGIVLSIVVSEAASNTASATVMVPVMIAVAQSAGVNPLPVALATCLACSFGFLLPVSTGPNALAYGTGHVTIPEMIRAGFALDVVGAVTLFLGFRLMGPLLGWQ
jgi:sodium-dependent dicarboxylate transporter 2/3/5